jgi:hypothetical protein
LEQQSSKSKGELMWMKKQEMVSFPSLFWSAFTPSLLLGSRGCAEHKQGSEPQAHITKREAIESLLMTHQLSNEEEWW